MIRNFTLTNALGASFSLMNAQQGAFFEPQGLGFDDATQYEQVGEFFAPLTQRYGQQVITGSMVFGSQPYEHYLTFTKFCQHAPLSLVYETDAGTFQIPCRLTKIEKGDTDGWTYLNCKVEFTALARMYKTVVANNTGTAGGGKVYLAKDLPDITGSIITIDNAEVGEVLNITADISPIQDLHGYDAPWVGGAGKNKANIDDSENGGIDANGQNVTDANNWRSKSLIPIKSGQAYTLHAIGMTITRLYFYDANGDFISPRIVSQTDTVTATSPSNAKYVKWTIYKTGITIADVQSAKVQLEEGSTATTFAPYSNICPISGHDDVGVSVCGVNLFDRGVMSNASTGAQYATLNLKPNTEYTMSSDDPCKNGGAITDLFFCNMDETVNSTTNGVKLGKPITRTSDANGQLRVGYRVYEGWITPTQLMAYNTQIEFGSVVTEYKEYTPPTTYTTDLGRTVYGGTLDVVSGVLTVDRAMVDLGTLNWTYNSSVSGYFAADGIKSSVKRPSGYGALCGLLSSNYEEKTTNQIYSGETGVGIRSSNGFIWVHDATISTTDPAVFKTAMNGVQVCYPLATPQTYQLTPQQIQTLLGQNNVWANSGDITITGRKTYGYKYNYTYGNFVADTVTIDSDSATSSPCRISIFGECTQPTWRHYLDGNSVATGYYNGTIPSGHKLVIDTTSSPYSIEEQDIAGNLIADRYELCDFSTERFFLLEYGHNTISVSHTDPDSIRLMVEGYIFYETV